jgi:prepilin-type N-terminal cleavage/methylation domain-containing protein
MMIAGATNFARRNKNGQGGFSLVEMVVAIAISAIVLAGTVLVLRAMLVSTADSTDKSLARLEVQYANFWIGDDVVQAQTVGIGNLSSIRYPEPFLVLTFNPWPYGQPVTVEYSVEEMKDKMDNNLWRLYRMVYKTLQPETSVVAEDLDPSLTTCYQKKSSDGTPLDVLVLQVASVVDNKTASGSYEISPRIGNETLWFEIP